MSRPLYSLALLILSLLAVIGCSGEKSEPEPQVSKDAGQQAASNWTDEQKAAFKKAHDEARAGGK